MAEISENVMPSNCERQPVTPEGRKQNQLYENRERILIPQYSCLDLKGAQAVHVHPCDLLNILFENIKFQSFTFFLQIRQQYLNLSRSLQL
jgi:hypothetical protein